MANLCDRLMTCVVGLALAASAVVVLDGADTNARQAASSGTRPNFVVFLTDDQGYGDLSSFGHPTIRTVNIDRMAAEGIRLTSFYAAPSCTPSRVQFLTGRYAFRSGLVVPYGPNAPNGIGPDEVTLADALKGAGYRTAMVGKWHLGDFASEPKFNPLRHGFDEFYGLPYSHDYRVPFVGPGPGVPLFRGLQEIERPVVANTLTKRYTEEALNFIRRSHGEPFFLYIAYNMPHLPAGASASFEHRSTAGRYGDAIEEIDWSVGQVQAALKAAGLDRNTVSVFFSDNGPWSNAPPRSFQEGQTLWDTGTAGPLRGAKGSTWEGGMRVPGVVRWPARIPAKQISSQMVSELDLFPTFVHLAGAHVAAERASDGYDILTFLQGKASSPRHELFYLTGTDLQAVRDGSWKLRVAESAAELFDVDRDPGERLNVADSHADVVERLRTRLEAFRAQLPSAPGGAATPH
jgi:arylsulfatase A-like enzyme